jgi:hypothetical protein
MAILTESTISMPCCPRVMFLYTAPIKEIDANVAAELLIGLLN